MDGVATLGVTMSNPWPTSQQPPANQAWPPPAPPGAAPLGRRAPEPVSINSYGPPPSKVTPAIVLIVVALSLIVGIFGYRLVATTNPAPSASPSPARTSEPTSTRSGGVPFEAKSDGAQGYWAVTGTKWTTDGLVVSVSVTVDQGQTRPTFYVFGNVDSTVYDPDSAAPTPAFGTPTVRQGQTASGNILFHMARGNATLVLTDSSGRQTSALPIQG